RLDRAPGRPLHRGRRQRLGERASEVRRRERQGHELTRATPTTERSETGVPMTRTVFTNANVLDGANPARPGQQAVLEGNRSKSAGESAAEPGPDDRVVDLAGMTLMPGMGTGHLHAEFHHIEMATLNQIYGGAERPAGVLMAVAINTCR